MKIPLPSSGQVTPPLHAHRPDVSDAGGVGDAIVHMGAALGQAADALRAARERADVAATQAALTQLESQSTTRWEDPETGALVTRQGFKSVDISRDMDALDRADYQQARDTVPKSQQVYFDAQWQAGQRRRKSRYSQFEREQTAHAQRQQLEVTVTTSIEQEGSAYDDVKAVELIRGARRHAIVRYGQVHGWSTEQTAAAMAEADQQGLRQRAQNYAVTQPQGWLRGDFAGRQAIDPVSVSKIDALAQAKINQQHSALRRQVEPQLHNTLAQLYNGEVPNALPDNAMLMAAYGEQGQQKVKQLDIALGNTMAFHAIQDASPPQQLAALERAKPHVNDPDYALRLEAYGRLRTLVQQHNDRRQAEQAAQRFNDAVVFGEKLDPGDSAMQQAAEASPAAQHFTLADPATHDAVVQLVAQTGLVPTAVTSALTAMAHARSPRIVQQGAALFNRLYETDAAAIAAFPQKTQAFYLMVKQYTDAGAASDEAIEQAQNATYHQTDSMKMRVRDEQRSADYKTQRTKDEETAFSDMKRWFHFDPGYGVKTPDTAHFKHDFRVLYDLNYQVTGGHEQSTKNMTQKQLSRTWRMSDVNGATQLMKYAPEALYDYGPAGWQAAQWQAEKDRLLAALPPKANASAPKTLAPLPGGSARHHPYGMTPAKWAGFSPLSSRLGGSLEIATDLFTPRTGDYAIMVRTKDKEGNESIVPFYDPQGSPLRWKPSLNDWAPYQKMQQAREQHEKKEWARAEKLRAFNDKQRALEAYQERVRKHSQPLTSDEKGETP